jgi:hypothetical protein
VREPASALCAPDSARCARRHQHVLPGLGSLHLHRRRSRNRPAGPGEWKRTPPVRSDQTPPRRWLRRPRSSRESVQMLSSRDAPGTAESRMNLINLILSRLPVDAVSLGMCTISPPAGIRNILEGWQLTACLGACRLATAAHLSPGTRICSVLPRQNEKSQRPLQTSLSACMNNPPAPTIDSRGYSGGLGPPRCLQYHEKSLSAYILTPKQADSKASRTFAKNPEFAIGELLGSNSSLSRIAP